MSFLHRLSLDAQNACHDVYHNWVLGDDAGKSVRFTFVLRPSSTRQAPVTTATTTTTTITTATATTASPSKGRATQTTLDPPIEVDDGVLVPNSAGGDDDISLGMTFLEINGRAYVKTVEPGSQADRAGIAPQDAVQFACFVNSQGLFTTPPATSTTKTNNNKTSSDSVVMLGETSHAEKLAIQFALEQEAQGRRISYDELRDLLRNGFIDPLQNSFLSPGTQDNNSPFNPLWMGPPIPTNVCIPLTSTKTRRRHRPQEDIIRSNNNDRDSYPDYSTSSVSGSIPETSYASRDPRHPAAKESEKHLLFLDDNDIPNPVVFVFRRTRQRNNRSTHLLLPHFRLDDECDFACQLVQRLAPTADMDVPPPNTWEELVHDGTDWLLGKESMLPPRQSLPTLQQQQLNDETASIPLDEFEQARHSKVAQLRSLMAAESMQIDRTGDVEAATVRGMIQKAVGLAFVRSSKVVLGISLHAGSGIVIARLSDGTWSAPSAIGTFGVGFGLQFGLEVAEYIFILQTQESLEHFRRGGSFTIGGNAGVAVAGLGREAYGAASLSPNMCGYASTVQDDEYNDSSSYEDLRPSSSLGVAPIVAYAKSQGLYMGVSLEGSRIFSRDDINSRTYKFETGRDVTANDILSGKVPTPPEAEELYAALHSVEFTHEMSRLPRPPELLRMDSANAWHYDRSTLNGRSGSAKDEGQPFTFLSSLTAEAAAECDAFEAQFKNFMYGGVSVQRLIPDKETRSGQTVKERRTLWLMLPEVGSLQLGFVSKLSDGEGSFSNKSSTQQARKDDRSRLSGIDGEVGTVASEDLTLDSALHTKDGSTVGQIRSGNVQLSNKHSVALTDVTVLSQDPPVAVRFNGEDRMEHLRIISIQDVSGTLLLFLANNFREAELLVCGLKLLLERESARLGVRGGLPLTAFGGRYIEGAMSPSAARGFRDIPATTRMHRRSLPPSSKGRNPPVKRENSTEQEEMKADPPEECDIGNLNKEKWGKVPGRNYMRGQAAAVVEIGDTVNEHGIPHYVHGQTIVRDIARNARLPLPLPLCRVLLLDSTSPVIKAWERDRGDSNFESKRWAFPTAAPRETRRYSSEHQLIASGSMCGAHRICSFDRPRYNSLVRLTETHVVEADDAAKVVFTITEHSPRRGFSVRVRIVLRSRNDNGCTATIVAEIRPVGKEMSNQGAVHRAFLLVQSELKSRYGADGHGLLAGFLNVVDDMASASTGNASRESDNNFYLTKVFRKTDPSPEEKKSDPVPAESGISSYAPMKSSGLVSFEEMLKTGRRGSDAATYARPPTPSFQQHTPEPDPSKRLSAISHPPKDIQAKSDQVTIEVRPLPKIRLSLLPSPREEDEVESNDSPAPSRPIRKKKSSRSQRCSDAS